MRYNETYCEENDEVNSHNIKRKTVPWVNGAILASLHFEH
ncbi:hypothetical protein QY97_00287 [Bacillus thermotolerans]|nr:hypothetical protein QY97_00287 [Bacillus thermotolerans]